MLFNSINYEIAAVGFDILIIALLYYKKALPTIENKNFKYYIHIQKG